MSKKEEAPQKILLGRPSNNLKMGIVGLPNVGKSTLFNVLTKLTVPAENYPFCTINPSEARCALPDVRFDFLCDKFKPLSKVPAYLSIMDIAGLVKGASTGEGLGNKFLSEIRGVDGIFHVVRGFDNEDIVHVEGELDPVRDLAIISEELRIKDEDFVNAAVSEIEKVANRSNDKQKKIELEILKRVQDWICVQKKEVRSGDWKTADIEVLNSMNFLTAKPVVYLVNLKEADYISKKNKWLGKIKQWVDAHSAGDPIIPFCGAMEGKLLTMSTEEAQAFVKDNNTISILPKIIKSGYTNLHLINFFTCGEDEVRAWTVRSGSKAPQAGAVIHTDFEKGFICAEVMKYEDLKELGTESAVKAAGKYTQQGKTYEVRDGDIIFFRVNTPSSGGKKK